MGHFAVTNNITGILRNVNTPTADAQEARFFDNGGTIRLVESVGSIYVQGSIVNGLVQPGTIYIGTFSVDNLAATANIAPSWAARAIALHEMGHARYQQAVYQAQPGDNAPMSSKVDWCMYREGTASFYSYTVAKEMGWHVVAGTNKNPNLYDTIDAALAGIDPRSSVYEQIGIAAAKAAWAADPKYVAYCSNPTNWSKPHYIPAEPPQTGSASPGTGSVIRTVYDWAPTPGGYWRPVPPHPSNSQLPDPITEPELQSLALLDANIGLIAADTVGDLHSSHAVDIIGISNTTADIFAGS